eukprot:8809762-Pyramimonas_sp.AAC.1
MFRGAWFGWFCATTRPLMRAERASVRRRHRKRLLCRLANYVQALGASPSFLCVAMRRYVWMQFSSGRPAFARPFFWCVVSVYLSSCMR